MPKRKNKTRSSYAVARRAPMTVRTAQDGEKELLYVRGNFGYHEIEREEPKKRGRGKVKRTYRQITHIPSGYLVYSTPNMRTARRAVNEMAARNHQQLRELTGKERGAPDKAYTQKQLSDLFYLTSYSLYRAGAYSKAEHESRMREYAERSTRKTERELARMRQLEKLQVGKLQLSDKEDLKVYIEEGLKERFSGYSDTARKKAWRLKVMEEDTILEAKIKKEKPTHDQLLNIFVAEKMKLYRNSDRARRRFKRIIDNSIDGTKEIALREGLLPVQGRLF